MLLGSLLGPSWGHFGSHLGVIFIDCLLVFLILREKRPFRRQEGSEGDVGPLLDPFWTPEATPKRTKIESRKRSKNASIFASMLGPSWAPLGASWAPLGGLSGSSREPLGRLLGASGGLLGTIFAGNPSGRPQKAPRCPLKAPKPSSERLL